MIINNAKEQLFNLAKKRNLFWSYSKDIKLSDLNDNLIIETILKYGEVKELNNLFQTYSYNDIFNVWLRRMIFDHRFEKLNFYLSKVYFDEDLINLKEQNVYKTRYEKLRLLASQN